MLAPELLTQLQDDWQQLGSPRRVAFARALRDRVQKRRNVLPFPSRSASEPASERSGEPAAIISLDSRR